MALIENFQPQLQTKLRVEIIQEAISAAYQYQLAMNPSNDVRDMSVFDLLGVASIHYQRRRGTDWAVGSKEYPVP